MQWQRTIAIVATASSVSGVASVPAFAQTDTSAPRETSASTVIGLGGYSPVLRVYGSEQLDTSSNVALPPNLTFSHLFRQRLEAMLERSHNFRRQCLRIAQTPGLSVRLANARSVSSNGPRAVTEIATTPDGRRAASISIRTLDNVIELIAHELEHVIEQLDGVNLRARSAVEGSGVWSCGDGSFETTRAVRIGRAVARETGQVH
jgi:hypothetical protein